MAYLIDPTYFIRELSIPGLADTETAPRTRLTEYIDGEARYVLKEALGVELFEVFDTFIDQDGNLSPSAPDIWQRLVNGFTYQEAGRQLRWEGLIYTEGTFKTSLLAYYVFYRWMFNEISFLGTAGEYVPNAKGATTVRSNQRQITAYWKFLEMYQGDFYSDVYQNRAYAYYYRRGLRVIDYLGYGEQNNYVSLLRFLSDRKEDYPEPALRMFEGISQIGI